VSNDVATDDVVHCSRDEEAFDRSSDEENGRVVMSAASITWRSRAPTPMMLLSVMMVVFIGVGREAKLSTKLQRNFLKLFIIFVRHQHRKLKAGFSWEEAGCEAGNILGRVIFGK
jgi:hypothetical protein